MILLCCTMEAATAPPDRAELEDCQIRIRRLELRAFIQDSHHIFSQYLVGTFEPTQSQGLNFERGFKHEPKAQPVDREEEGRWASIFESLRGRWPGHVLGPRDCQP